MTKKKLSLITIISLSLALFFGFQAITALRSNSLEASRLLNKVFEADEKGGDVEGSLNELRTYVFSHMNTNLSKDTSIYPPIQLKYTYERLVEAEKKKVEKASATVYADAQKYCEEQNSKDFSGRNRIPCIQKYVSEHKVTETPVEDDLYKFDFASPSWSPDKAGLSLLATGFFAFTSGLLILREYLTRK